VAKSFEDGKSHHTELVVTSKTGEQYNVLVWTAPLRNADGEITEVMEISTNITEIRQLQDNLSSLGLKISSISHGIKGLLAGLDGGIYLVDTGFAKENQERIQEGWESVRTIISRIRKLVLDILYFAKERELNIERIEILSFARDISFVMEPKIQEQGIEFVCDFDPTVGEYYIDPGAVRSALINLLENALDACVDDTLDKLHEITFAVKQKEGKLIFEVKDNGVGMDRETQENLFNLFFSSKGNKGTGLGLFVTNQIVQQHGGTIEVQSIPGQGSTFCISIPKDIPNSSEKNGLSAEAAASTYKVAQGHENKR
jgi:signal transduction histidine kinase